MGILADQFTVATATQTGREHVRVHRNNQDGLAVRRHDDFLVAVVTDGCSSAPHSEVGAKLGAAWLANWAASCHERFQGLGGAELPQALNQGLQRFLKQTARRLDPDPGALARTVHDFLLFTFQLALVTPRETLVCGVGDGVVGINGEVTALVPGEGNMPAYPAYGLLEGAQALPVDLRPVVHFQGPTDGVHTLLVATDGAWELESKAQVALADGHPIGGLAPLMQDARFERNPSLLQKRLTVIGEINRHLHDDTTLAIVRRKEG